MSAVGRNAIHRGLGRSGRTQRPVRSQHRNFEGTSWNGDSRPFVRHQNNKPNTTHTTHTHTHTHTEAKEKLQTGARANSKDVRLSILTGVTGNNLNRFSQRSTKLCIYIPSHKSTARPPVPSARTFLFSLFLSLACMYTTAHFGDRLE